MFANLPQVTKNILILNIMFFVATLILGWQGIYLKPLLGTHYVNSPLFEPYQVVTHFFMHADFFHILMNMWLFVMLGAYLENLWGPKRFFIFYLACALGAFALHNAIGVYELQQLKQALIAQNLPIDEIDNLVKNGMYNNDLYSSNKDYENYVDMASTPMVGASGAIFGVLSAFAILFPNTEFRLYFAIPIKAKYFVGAYLLLEIYLAFQNQEGDSTAHLAHIGGAIVGAALILIWRKKDRQNFY
jgi:membrane associated rhomboid family serine protease